GAFPAGRIGMHATLRDANPPLTPSVEDYLKVIYHLSNQGGFAATSDIAAMLEVAPPSVSGMVKRLSETGLIEHVPYRGVQLTAQGRRAALRMIRRHRLLELSGDPRVVGRELALLLWCREVPVTDHGYASR